MISGVSNCYCAHVPRTYGIRYWYGPYNSKWWTKFVMSLLLVTLLYQSQNRSQNGPNINSLVSLFTLFLLLFKSQHPTPSKSSEKPMLNVCLKSDR